MYFINANSSANISSLSILMLYTNANISIVLIFILISVFYFWLLDARSMPKGPLPILFLANSFLAYIEIHFISGC